MGIADWFYGLRGHAGRLGRHAMAPEVVRRAEIPEGRGDLEYQ
jgi:hypothetical protein